MLRIKLFADKMKSIVSILLLIFFLSSCVSNRIGSGGWPERNRDPKLNITDTKHYLSKSDINTIHEMVWAKNANLRIFSIRVVKPGTVLVICTDMPGESFPRSLGFDMVKTKGVWDFGTYKAKNIVSPL